MFESLSEKQIRDRIRFLSDKMEEIWAGITPQLKEFDELRVEFEQLYSEFNNRGLLDDTTLQPRTVAGESPE